MEQVEALRAAVEKLEGETAALRAALFASVETQRTATQAQLEAAKAQREATQAQRERTRTLTRASLVVGVFLLASIVLLGFAAVDSRHRVQESERRWCPMVSLLIPGRGEPGPTTQRGVQITEQAKALAKVFGCPPVS
jgi:multidrug efflux pump subunit AcrA (membrane-fusion protein)